MSTNPSSETVSVQEEPIVAHAHSQEATFDLEPEVSDLPVPNGAINDDIPALNIPQLLTAWNQSTDELLVCHSQPDIESIALSETTEIDGVSSTPPNRSSDSLAQVSVQIELAEHQTDRTPGPSSSRSSASTAPLPRQACARMSMPDGDIELQDFIPPPSRNRSTQQLVPRSGEKLPSEPPGKQDVDGGNTATETTRAILTEKPNYKPLPLRWQFQVFLLVMIAGILGFLEYQIRDLPPVHYKIIDIDPPMKKRNPVANHISLTTTTVESDVSIQPSPAIKSFPLAASTTPLPATTAMVVRNQLLAAAPDPTPDPRPPETLFPGPPTGTNTHCGWERPLWLLYMIPDFPAGNTSTTRVAMKQTIPTFFTDDESWCPCYVEVEPGSDPMDPEVGWDQWIIFRGWVISSHDRECRSIMSAVYNHNGARHLTIFKPTPGSVPFTTTTLSRPALQSLFPSLLAVDSHHPAVEISDWPWPSTNAEGGIFLPFELTTFPSEILEPIGFTIQDDFGDDVGPPSWTAFFHASQPNSMFTPIEILSTKWWQLPFSGPPAPPQVTTTSGRGGEGGSSRDTTTPSSAQESTMSHTSAVSHPVLDTSTLQASTGSTDSTDSIISTISTTLTTLTTLTKEQNAVNTTSVSSQSSPDKTKLDQQSTGSTNGSESIHTSEPSHPLPSSSNMGVKSTEAADATAMRGLDGSSTAAITTQHASGSLGSASGTLVKHTSDARTQPYVHYTASNAGGTLLLEPIVKSTTEWWEIYLGNPAKTMEPADTVTPRPLPGPIPPGAGAAFSNLRSQADFLMASVIPVLLTTILGIVMQVFISSISSMQPFRALGYPGGAFPEDSLTLPRSSPLASLTGVRLMYRYGDTLPVFNVLLSTLLTVLIPASSEVIRVEFSSRCGSLSADGGYSTKVVCAFGLRKSTVLVRVTESILAVLAALVVGMGFLLFRWRTGVAAEPWSIASMACLLSSSDDKFRSAMGAIPPYVHGSYIRDGQIKAALGESRRFRMGFYDINETRGERRSDNTIIQQGYGIETVAETAPVDDKTPIRVTTRDPPDREAITPADQGHKMRRWWHVTPDTRDLAIRALALTTIIGLLILILYYENTIAPNTRFEEFMNSETFGVRILFTSFGTIISLFWDYYLSSKLNCLP